MQNFKKVLVSLAVIVLLFVLVIAGGYIWRESHTVFIPIVEDQIDLEPVEAPLDFAYFDSKEYPENSLAALVQKTSALKENFSGRDLDQIFCFEAGTAEDQSIRCVRPAGIKVVPADATVQAEFFQNASRDLEFEVKENTAKTETSKPVLAKLDPNFVDENKYAENTIATYIQENPEIMERFKGKPLTDEFCFYAKISEAEYKIRCIVPQKILDGDEIYFDRILNEILPLERNDNMRTLPLEETSAQNQTFIASLMFDTDAYSETSKNLKSKYEEETADQDEVSSVSYIYALEGDYAKSEEVAAYNCENFEVQCTKDSKLVLSGMVKDGEGLTMSGAKIEVLSDEKIASVLTDSEGKYQVEFATYDFVKVRIKASKVGYSEGVIPLNIYNNASLVFDNLDFVLNAPAQAVTLDNENKTFVGDGVSIEGENFVIQTEWNKYTIPFDALVYRDGSPFIGEVDVFLFDFDKDSDIQTLLANDTFDEVVGYSGNLMVTYGMPFILFKTSEGETIHVLKSNPMTLENQVIEMEALYTNQDQIYSEVTEEDMEYLYAKSQELVGYPIDREFLINEDMVRFPPFWVFDQASGVWENIGMKLLNTTGLLEVQFYTLNDL